jgi:SAM-dependent methyltransferase
MPNPWLSIPLSDYEGHMAAPDVEQLPALSLLFARVLQQRKPRSLAVLGIAGGNGLEHIGRAITRVVGVDIRAEYLDEVRRRFPALPLELHCLDLAAGLVRIPPVDLVHAALIFEHTGLDRALDNAVSLVAPGGALSVVLQRPSTAATVTPSAFATMQSLRDHVSVINVETLRPLVEAKGLTLVNEDVVQLPGQKSFWLGIFSR